MQIQKIFLRNFRSNCQQGQGSHHIMLRIDFRLFLSCKIAKTVKKYFTFVDTIKKNADLFESILIVKNKTNKTFSNLIFDFNVFAFIHFYVRWVNAFASNTYHAVTMQNQQSYKTHVPAVNINYISTLDTGVCRNIL